MGTVQLNRKFLPKDLNVSARSDINFRTSVTRMLAISWMDQKQVDMLVTIHGPDIVDLPPNHCGIVWSKPHADLDYNMGMKGVDLSDQLASYSRKSQQWYQYVFITCSIWQW